MLDVSCGESQHFGLLDALNAEVTPIFDSEAIFQEAEVTLSALLIMNQGGNIDDEVFRSKVLQDREP